VAVSPQVTSAADEPIAEVIEPEPAAAASELAAKPPLDLTLDLADSQEPGPPAESGELALRASDEEPVPPRFGRAQPDPGSEGAPRSPPGSSLGSTLFERMANLSRGGDRVNLDDPDEQDGSTLNIPRFLGRQNNQ